MFGRKKDNRKKEVAPSHDDFFSAIEKADDVEDKGRDWINEQDEEGQLSVDVYEEGDNIIVQSTIAGVEPEDIDISINNDLLTIRGERSMEKHHRDKNYFFQECYWGAFSRSIILPVEVDAKSIDATMKNGILTITLPKAEAKSEKPIKVKDRS
mgnify:CR=1 FL=1